MSGGPGTVVACIPHFHCRRYIRRAVESLLRQSYRDLTVVVVNDGDTETPWSELAQIHDPRLVRYSLERNHGPYFATEVVLNATSSPYLLIQDADDWSAPRRVEGLLSELERQHADFAFSAHHLYKELANGQLVFQGMEWCQRPCTTLSDTLLYRFPHTGLWRVRSLRNIGGYYGGFKFGYDRFLTSVVALVGKVSYVCAPLYHITSRPHSLMRNKGTGIGSSARAAMDREMDRMYKELYQLNLRFTEQALTATDLLMRLSAICKRHMSGEDERAVTRHSRQLRGLMQR